MATVYRKTFTKPLPAVVERFIRKGERFARWKDRNGKTRTAKVTTGKDGSERIIVEATTYIAKFRNGAGHVVEASTGCKTRDGALSVLKGLTDRSEKVRSGILTGAEDAISGHQQTPLGEHFDDYVEHLAAKGVTAGRVADT